MWGRSPCAWVAVSIMLTCGKMRLTAVLRTGILIAAGLIAATGLRSQKPDTPTEAQAKEGLGMPARAAASEYQAHAQAGSISIGAEFMGHSVPTPQAIFASDDYIVIETGFFGPPEARLKLSIDDFSIRINGKKNTLPNQHYELAFHSLRDPEWEPPALEKSKTSLNTGGQGSQQNDSPPPPPKMPLYLRRAMELKVQKAALLEGDRVLPQAGLIFFEYRGKAQGIHSIELIYEGAAGKATLNLQP
jgi:hypothetical protein